MHKYLYINNRKNIEEILTCPICLDIYKHPRNLKCGHPFCTTCLYMIKLNNSITCPICRIETKFNDNYLLIDLPVNNIITSIIDNSNLIIENKKLKKSKSVDSLLTPIKINKYNDIKIKKYFSILENNNIDSDQNINNINENNINLDNPRECCSFQ